GRVLRGIPIDDVVPHIDRNSLFKMSWQFRGVRDPDEWERLLRTELEPRLARSIAEARSEGFLDLQAAYGYWPALADGDTVHVHGIIRAELGLGADQGRRYSPGYASCPDLEGNRVLLGLLPATEVGVTLTDAAQLVPEQSTVALVMHHPEARYFDIHRAGAAA